MAGRSLENAVVRLLKRLPFHGWLLAGMRKQPGHPGKPVGVTLLDGVPTLFCDEIAFAAWSPSEQEALLEHCVLHLLHLHPARRKDRNRHDWDLACDLAINPAISAMPTTSPRPAYFSLPDGLGAEEYYRRLVDPFDTGNLSGAGTGTAEQETAGGIGSGSTTDRGQPIDDHAVWDEADSTPLRLAEEMVRSMVRDAWQKCDHHVPAELRPLVMALLAPPGLPWQMLLRQFVATAGRIGRRATWQRENRRFSHTTPGSRKRHRLNLLVGVDVSDSTDAPALREAFARELVRIAGGRDAQLTVLYANSRIRSIEGFRGKNVAVASYHGGGFTDLRPVFAYARDMHPLPAAVIYLTDGLGPAPERMEFPTLWVLTREGERPVPWGVELRLDC